MTKPIENPQIPPIIIIDQNQELVSKGYDAIVGNSPDINISGRNKKQE